ncbi:MAG: glycosyltransferase family 2 protein [Euzebyales bacterium]|jgi:glycosyltransferase involved in cell wall biosynthesis|nr:glycosyltransferase family 2 protein [Euzebyales bacterium]
MATSPAVSVVLIFYNDERFLPEAIESVLGQTYRDFELILADDGSTDGSTALARSYAQADPERVRYVEHPGHANHGISAARNLGIADVRGRFVAFLDSDDVWEPEKLADAAGTLAAADLAVREHGGQVRASSARKARTR